MTECLCDLCGSRLNDRVMTYPVGDSQSRSSLFNGIVCCSGCEIGYAVPKLSQARLDEIYTTGEYWDDVVKDNPYQNAHESNQARERVHFCSQYIDLKEGMKVLDIGAGHAYTSDQVSEAIGFDSFCFDFIEHDDQKSQGVLAKAKKYKARRISTPSESGDAYDLIFMNHVLEHVADPYDFVQAALESLNQGGVLYIETPAEDYRYKSDVFPHTLFFNKKSASFIAEKLGAELVCCNTYGRKVSDMGGVGSVRVKLLNQVFKIAVKCRMVKTQRWIDKLIWRYGEKNTDNIWLQWVLKK